jgi:hypothetical protein
MPAAGSRSEALEFGHLRIGSGIDLPFFVGNFVRNFVGMKAVSEVGDRSLGLNVHSSQTQVGSDKVSDKASDKEMRQTRRMSKLHCSP